jgi:hypothetical protein
VTVRFSKREGVPVRYVPADDPREAAAVREVDLQRKYHLSASDLARLAALTLPKFNRLRRYLDLDDDEDFRHVFVFDSQRIPRWSDAALQRMRDALEEVNMDEVGRSTDLVRSIRDQDPPRAQAAAASATGWLAV